MIHDCAYCDYDEHWCPGCGTPTPHVSNYIRSACEECAQR